MSTFAAARPVTRAAAPSTRAGVFTAVAAPIQVPDTMAASLESTVQRTRRLAVSAERRRARVSTLVSLAAVTLGSAGTLAFAALMVVSR